MVFVCSFCNSSLKKAQVKSHSCNAKFSCLTCNLEFDKITSQNHVLCISEAEKYQGTDFRAKKNENKGINRQNNWNSVVRDSLDNYKTEDNNLNKAINTLKSYQNIPQKESKFMNFIKTIGNFRNNDSYAKIVWDVITSHKLSLHTSKDDLKVEDDKTSDSGTKKRKLDNPEDCPNAKIPKIDLNNTELKDKKESKKHLVSETKEENCELLNMEVDKKKKKKNKKTKISEVNSFDNTDNLQHATVEKSALVSNEDEIIKNDNQQLESKNVKSKKEKVKSKVEPMAESSNKILNCDNSQPQMLDTNSNEMVLNKEKKSKKKNQTLPSATAIGNNCSETVLQKEKKPKKKHQTLTPATLAETITNGEVSEKKKKSKKKQSKEVDVTIVAAKGIEKIKEQISSFVDEIRQSGNVDIVNTPLESMEVDKPKKKKKSAKK